MEKAVQMQRQIKENSNELTDFLQDLTRWEEKIKKEDDNLKTSRRIDEKLPPIRKGKKESAKEKKEETNKNVSSIQQPAKNEKIKSYDYDAWSKFDVDKACKDIDKSDESNEEFDEENEEEIEKIEEEKKLQQATMEKDKGNQLFKEGKYDAAINRYTIAIGLHPTNPVFYANRGMALLKMERYGAAEQDCTFSLQLDPTYTKAFARRATARQKLKKYKAALEDFNSVLKYEPKNKQATSEIENIQKTLRSLEEQKEKNERKEETTTNIHENESTAKRKKRSNKPLKRVFIQEIGMLEDESEIKEVLNTPENSSLLVESLQKSNDRVPPLHQSNEVTQDIITLAAKDAPLVVPTSSFMFESELKRLKNDQETFYRYLKMIPCKNYTKLFHQCIDSLISCFLQTLNNCYVRDGLEIHEELENLSCVDRFGMATMFLSRKDKKALEDLFSYLKSKDYPGDITTRRLEELYKKFGMKEG